MRGQLGVKQEYKGTARSKTRIEGTARSKIRRREDS